MTPELLEVLRRLLQYSWRPINYQYHHLTESEKRIINRSQFNRLVEWVKAERNG